MTELIDIAILGLLTATVGYAFFVERRVRALMQALSDLQPTVLAFSDAVDRSEDSVAKLKSTTQGQEGAPRPRQRGRAPEVLRVPAKAELIKSFFESARELKA